KKLEKMSADILGKEDALFTTSGTLANQIAVMTFTNRGEEVIIGDTSHIYNLEVGALAALSQVQTRPINVENGYYDIEKMESLIRNKGIQNAKTGLICIENTNNLNAGFVVPIDNINAVCELGKKHHIPVYMDGARIFNAAVALDVEVKDIVKNVDAVMFALTKGLCAPFGAILAGDKEFIEKARWIKQRLGGGFRQAGFLAAPAIVAIKEMIPRLKEDNKNAKILGEKLSAIEGLDVNVDNIHTSILTGSVKKLPITIDEFLDRLKENKIKAKRISDDSFRMVTHLGIEENEIERVVKVVKETINNI
ncbi:threonine aldolase family protein, partial [Senegalia sp. (in: firmicutes)]